MRIRKYVKLKLALVLVIACVGVLNSCSNSMKGVKASQKLFTDFFVGDEGTQYFIKPLTFKNSVNSKERLLLDMTFRYKEAIKDSAALNFSIVGEMPIKELMEVNLISSNFSVKSEDVKLLFNERVKGGYISRFTLKLPLISIKKLVDAGYDWKVEAKDSTSKALQYTSTKTTTKSLEMLNQALFILLD